jgi:tol-pal system protein YbgF
MNKIKITAVCITMALVIGCSNLTMLRTQELRNVQAHVDSLSTTMTQMQQKLMEEQKTQSEMLRLMRADQQVRFNEIDRKVSAVQGNLSESQVRLTKIDEKTVEFQKKMEAKFAADSVAATSKANEIEKLFQIAMSDFNAGRYDIAMNGFKDLVAQHPESPLSQDAEYWIAESNYAKKEFVEAEKAYMAYIKNYPEGSKICVSLYKLGLVADRLNKSKHKALAWKKLVEQCPESQEAKVVRAQSGD